MRISMPWLICSSLSHPPRQSCEFLSTYETHIKTLTRLTRWWIRQIRHRPLIQQMHVHRHSVHTHTHTCMSPQAFPWSPQPLFSPTPLPPRVSLEIMPATTAGSTSYLLAALMILSLYLFMWSKSLDASWWDAGTPASKRKLEADFWFVPQWRVRFTGVDYSRCVMMMTGENLLKGREVSAIKNLSIIIISCTSDSFRGRQKW